MRIAVVGNGRSVHVLSRSAALAARGHAVRLVTAGPVLEGAGVEVRTRPLPRTPWAAARAARGFFRDVRDFRPDLLHLHYAGGRFGTLATLTGVHPLAATVMGGDVLPDQHRGGMSALERRATRRVLAAADLVLVKSERLRSAVLAFGDLSAKVHVVRWGVDPERFRRDVGAAARVRERLSLPARAQLVLSPRLLAPLYNIDLVVDAFPRVLREAPDAILLIAEYGADPVYRGRVQGQVDRLGLAAHVRFLGQVPHADMPTLYSAADVSVSVPRSDGLPQSLFEAMACETPSVVGRLEAYDEVLGADEVAVTVALQSEAIAAGIVRLLTDEGRRRSMGRRARARVEAIACLPAEVERVEALFAGAIRAAPPARRRGLGDLVDALSLLAR